MITQKILMISPHLDDAVFSVGGLAAALAAAGHEVTILTCFTQSVAHPTGFALACQLDKGLNATADYMQLRREEDTEACKILGARPIWLDLPEAPHRGYNNAKELFETIKPSDTVQEKLYENLEKKISQKRPYFIFSPLGIGNHVDHQQVVKAVNRLKEKFPDLVYFKWCDQPYLLRNPSAMAKVPQELIFKDLEDLKKKIRSKRGDIFFVKTTREENSKFDACQAYRTQVDFQFGSSQNLYSYLKEDFYEKPLLAEFITSH